METVGKSHLLMITEEEKETLQKLLQDEKFYLQNLTTREKITYFINKIMRKI